MTSETFHDNPFDQDRKRAWSGRILGLAALIALGLVIWHFAGDHAVSIKKEQPVSQLMAVMPPPPPPPPPPKPQQVVKETVPVPQQQQQQQPRQQSPVKDNAVTENAPAQAGTDAFQLGAGSGDGMRGSGGAGMFNLGAYTAYLAQTVRQAVQKNDALQNRSFRVAVDIWLNAAGKITRAELRSSSGSDVYDKAIQDLLLAMPAFDQAPPQSVIDTLPVKMTIDLRRSL